jgi:hypothetical protein
MTPLPCSCDKGVAACIVALALWQDYIDARGTERDLMEAITDPQSGADEDPIMYDRYRLAGELRRDSLRKYERHVDGEDDLLPVPPRLLHDVVNGP